MRTLAFDTTGTSGSLAALDDDHLVAEVPIASPDGVSAILFDAVGALLLDVGWALRDIDCFASASGPGTFTGVRVGLAAIKSLAEALGRPAIAVSNLQALASCGTADLRAVVIDAHRGDAYAAVYDRELHLVSPEVVAPFTTWISPVSAKVGEIITPDFSPFRPDFTPNIPIVEQAMLAAAVGRLARARLLAGEVGEPAVVDANYVRRNDARMNWKDEPVARTS